MLEAVSHYGLALQHATEESILYSGGVRVRFRVQFQAVSVPIFGGFPLGNLLNEGQISAQGILHLRNPGRILGNEFWTPEYWTPEFLGRIF